MKHSLFSSIIFSICFVISIAMASCTNTSKETDSPKTVSADTTAQAETPPQAATSATPTSSTLDSHLYPLWTDINSVTALASTMATYHKKRLVLNFYVDVVPSLPPSNYLTLRGWIPSNPDSTSDDTFNSTPNITLQRITDASSITLAIGQKTSLGNLVISRKTFNSLRRQINNHPGQYKYLMFYPSIDSYGQIFYTLSLSTINTNPKVLIPFTGDGFANPTPPRNYDGTDLTLPLKKRKKAAKSAD